MSIENVTVIPFQQRATNDWERVAETIVERTAEIVGGRVAVLDGLGIVVTCNDRVLIGLAAPAAEREAGPVVHVPFRLHGRDGAVLVAANGNDGVPLPPRVLHSIVELIVDHAGAATGASDQTELKNRLIFSLLRETPRHPQRALRDAKLLGMDLSPPRAVILIDTAPTESGPSFSHRRQADERARQVVAMVMRFFDLPDDTICAWDETGQVAVLKASDSRNLESWLSRDDGPDPPGLSWANLAALRRAATALLESLLESGHHEASIGIGRYHPGVEGLARTYADARAALSLGKRFNAGTRVHSLDALGIAAFVGLADEATKISLARHLLSPLDHEPTLVQTLNAFFETDCCPSATAKSLGIHRNTLSYRLGKIANLTGLDAHRFDDAVQMRVALVLRSLGAAECPSLLIQAVATSQADA
jgi:carbohydrate diacid regulator